MKDVKQRISSERALTMEYLYCLMILHQVHALSSSDPSKVQFFWLLLKPRCQSLHYFCFVFLGGIRRETSTNIEFQISCIWDNCFFF